ncbi:MAG: hypothetical protein V4694_03380 [Pseudomonadota bacterium]
MSSHGKNKMETILTHLGEAVVKMGAVAKTKSLGLTEKEEHGVFHEIIHELVGVFGADLDGEKEEAKMDRHKTKQMLQRLLDRLAHKSAEIEAAEIEAYSLSINELTLSERKIIDMVTNSFDEANKLDFLKHFLEEEKKDDNLKKLVEAFQHKIAKIEEGKAKFKEEGLEDLGQDDEIVPPLQK